MVTRTDYRLARAPIERLYRQYDTDKHFQIRFVPVSPGDHRDVEPPDPIPNSAVKRVIADGSVGSPHVRVGHRQALITRNPGLVEAGVFALGRRTEATAAASVETDKRRAKERARRYPCGGPCH